MTVRFNLLAATAMACLLSGCGRQSGVGAGPEGVAIVGGRAVPAWKLEQQLRRTGPRGVALDPQRAVAELIEREQLVARALRLELDRDPSVQRAWETALIAKLKERELEPALRAAGGEGPPGSPKAERRTSGATEQVRLAMLRLEAGPKAGADKMRRLEKRLEEAKSRAATLPPGTAGFGPLTLEYSDDDATRARGGDLGWLEADGSKYHLDPQVLAAGFALQRPGEVSPIVHGESGLYLMRLMDRRRIETEPEADEALARHREHLVRQQAVEAEFLDTIRRTIPVMVNTGLVEQVIARSRPTGTAPHDDEAHVHLSATGVSISHPSPAGYQ